MVFQAEGQFQPFLHCKFRENVVRLLHIPSLEDGNLFLCVNKYGAVGLYHERGFGLIHTYCLDLSVQRTGSRGSTATVAPKCGRTHLVVDAVYAPDLQLVIFATTKGLLQCYDIGEIENENLGLEILPRKLFQNLRDGSSPVTCRNRGHVETHRIIDLDAEPSCLEYSLSSMTHQTTEPNIRISGKSGSKLLIGDNDGTVTILLIDDPKFPFLGHRKIRGTRHQIKMTELRKSGKVRSYKAHIDPVREIRFLTQRQSILSCSRDSKFSIFCEDFTGITDSFIISLPKGVNCLTYSGSLEILVTGCEDGIVRIFRHFSMRMPQLELLGHKSSVMAVEFLSVPFSDKPILITFSADAELRAWDPESFKCLQSLYIRFPINSTIMCKTPQFAKRSLVIHQPHYNPPLLLRKTHQDFEIQPKTAIEKSRSDDDGFIILLYCNSYAKLGIETDKRHWPFDFDEFATEFEELTNKFDRRLRNRLRAKSKDPNLSKLTKNEESEIEVAAVKNKDNLMDLKSRIEDQFNCRIYNPAKPTLGCQGMTGLHSFDAKTPFKERMLRRTSTMFDKIPIYDIQPPQISQKLSSSGHNIPSQFIRKISQD